MLERFIRLDSIQINSRPARVRGAKSGATKRACETLRSCQRMTKPTTASLRQSAPRSLRGRRGKHIFAGRSKIMMGSCLLLLIGVGSLLMSSSSVGSMDDVLSILSSRYTANSVSLLFWDAPEPPLPTESVEVCFITSIYGKTAAMADKPGDFKNFKLFEQAGPNTFAFFLYTNLEDLRAPGWHKIIKRDLPYRRYITQSRWGKFMGWKDPELQWCKTIFYFDGHFEPRNHNAKFFLDMAAKIRKSDVGLAQVRHPMPDQTLLAEFQLILNYKKDIPKNVEASIKWFEAQPDFFNNCTLYANWYFGYDPANENFQKATEYFWNHYSLEEDSWRDQPLWCYTLEHFHLTPLKLGPLFGPNQKRMGHKGHQYDATQDNDAAAAVVGKT